jgi:D-alanine-D-alanine ligase
VDAFFSVLHGTFGEDGTMQGLLRLTGVPFVGAGVLGSAVGMDKDVCKRLLRAANIPVADWQTLRAGAAHADADALFGRLGCPLFVKPANQGSSVGVAKVSDAAGLHAALREAFAFDRKVLVEAFVDGREIECSVLGNDEPIASVPGEIVPAAEFYSYRAKYVDADGAALCVPADLPAGTADRVRALALQTCETLECEGLARVDFFVRPDGSLIVNEINTLPGFTRISMYPRLWEATGIGYGELVDRLIALALERHERERRLCTAFTPPECP